MTVSNFIPQLWAATLLRTMEKSLVYAAVANRGYEGEIKNAGDTVKITAVGPVSVGDYSTRPTITPQELETAQQLLTIDQQKYFAFKLDDVDAAQAKGGLMEAGMAEAAYGLRDVADQYMAAFHADAAHTVTEANLDSGNIISTLGLVGQKLNEANAPQEGRFIIVPPWVYLKMQLAKIVFDKSNSQIISDGYIGRALNFDIFMSNNVPTTGTAPDYTSNCLAGIRGAFAYAEQILKTEAFRQESSFADAIKGLHVYGAKVIRPEMLVKVAATYEAETTV